MSAFRTLDSAELKGKRVLVRVDLNVPMDNGKVTDATRIDRILPTLNEISGKGGKVILLAHFGRPKNGPDQANSLKPVAAALAAHLGKPVAFARRLRRPGRRKPPSPKWPTATCCCWKTPASTRARKRTTRRFVARLAALGDVYVNDAFSAAHRAHASTEGACAHAAGLCRPHHAGRDRGACPTALDNPARPVAAIVGGAKVSTKLELLGNLIQEGRLPDHRRRHGQHLPGRPGQEGRQVLCENDLPDTAREILNNAAANNARSCCRSDAVVATEFRAHAPSHVVSVRSCRRGRNDPRRRPEIGRRQSKRCWTRPRRWSGTAPSASSSSQPFDAGDQRRGPRPPRA